MIEQFEGIDKFISRIDKDLYFDPYGIHGISHITRVLMILDLIFERETLNTSEKTILSYAGLYHDIGRIDNTEDEAHGFNSYKKIIKFGLLDGVNLNAEEFEIMKFIIEFHCINDASGYASIKGYDIQNVEMAMLLYSIFKDADGLDRIRINDLDIKYLRCESSKTLIPKVKEIYKSFQKTECENISMWDKGLLEHFHYLKDKGLYDIEFQGDSVKAKRPMSKSGSLPSGQEEGKIRTQRLDISLVKDNSQKIMYHGTSLRNARKIITDNIGLTNSSIDINAIEYNKIFMANYVFESRNYGLRKGSNSDDILIVIDTSKYKVYTFIENTEWIIWGDIDIEDIKFIYYKDGVSMGELTSQEIMELPTVEYSIGDIFFEALSKNNIYLFKDTFGKYGVHHAQRIILILRQLNSYELLPLAQRAILAWVGLYHDIGMKDNKEDILHGLESYSIIFNTGLIDNAKGLNAEELEIMRFIIICHCMDDEGASKALSSWPTIKNVKMAKLLYDMFKDAEELEKMGLSILEVIDLNITDIKKLRRPYSFMEIGAVAEVCKPDYILKLIS